ncbi:MAG: DUF4388 domain-containing protein [Acidobacteria bacterium]|nr:DUF4388 domain-containing protein [Acidobacteriota bacterium]
MSEGLGIQGALDETTVPDLMRSLLTSSETAMMSLESGERHDTIFFEDGDIVYAASSDPDLSLAAVLLRGGELSLQQFRKASEEMSPSKSMSVVLTELEFMNRDELMFAQQRRTTMIVKDAVAFRNGRYSIDFVTEMPPEIIRNRADTLRLVLDAVEGIEMWSLIDRGVQRIRGRLTQADRADMKLFTLDVTEKESHIYSMLVEPLTVDELCQRSYMSNFETCRTVWALFTGGLITESAAGALSEKRRLNEEEFELEALVEKYNSIYQVLFQIVFREIGDYTWDFVDRVVRHLAPDRMPFVSGISMTNEARVDFDQLYNNLVASGLENRRETANDVLNQLLYGWIVETRQEFGSRLQGEIDRVVAPLLKT